MERKLKVISLLCSRDMRDINRNKFCAIGDYLTTTQVSRGKDSLGQVSFSQEIFCEIINE
jgi:hypothetical protein